MTAVQVEEAIQDIGRTMKGAYPMLLHVVIEPAP